MKKALCALLCVVLALSACPVFAADQSEQETAAAYLRQQGIMVGDANGNMNLEASLNRAELAVLLTRLNGGSEAVNANPSLYTSNCEFTDVPAWAKPYVGYCAKSRLMSGYGGGVFGPGDPVIPAMACTVVLRACGAADGEGNVWSYNTACSYAADLGWVDEATTRADAITRGDMAVVIYRALTDAKPEDVPSLGTGDGYLTNGKPVTEENVLELLRQLEAEWPTGTVWGTQSTPGTHKNTIPSTESGRIMRGYHVSNVYGCGAYASMVSSLIFGDTANPGRKLDDLSHLRPGDIVFLVSPEGKVGHVAVALESPNQDGRFHRTEGNLGETIQWPDTEDLRSYSLSGFTGGSPRHLEVWSRYPESVPYTGDSVETWPTGTAEETGPV